MYEWMYEMNVYLEGTDGWGGGACADDESGGSVLHFDYLPNNFLTGFLTVDYPGENYHTTINTIIYRMTL